MFGGETHRRADTADVKNPPLHHDVLSPGTLHLSRCEFLIDYCMEVFVFAIARNSVVFNGNGNANVHPVANHFSAFFFQGLQSLCSNFGDRCFVCLNQCVNVFNFIVVVVVSLDSC